jgi:hypothetical protein
MFVLEGGVQLIHHVRFQVFLYACVSIVYRWGQLTPVLFRDPFFSELFVIINLGWVCV